jgi:hypothetical protein
MPKFIKFWFDRVWESFSRARGIVELGLFILVLLSKQVSAKVVWLCFFVVFIVEVCFVAPYRHAKSIESKLNELTDTKKHEREKRVHECVDATVGILKSDQPLMPFHALSRANAYRLESNDEVVEVCKRIEACGYGHPLRGPRDEWVVPESDWLAFLKRVKYAPGVNPDAKWDYLLEAEKWRNDHGYPEPTAQDRMA